MSLDAKTAEIAAGHQTTRTARLGLRARLFALVLVAMLPALAIQAYSEITGRIDAVR
jgi:hypothetical protein